MAVDIVTHLIVYAVKEKLTNFAEINGRILNFEYSEVHKTNPPNEIKEKPLTKLKAKQTAAEMWNFLTVGPLIIGDLVPTHDPLWKTFIDFVGYNHAKHKKKDAKFSLYTVDLVGGVLVIQ